MVAAHCMWANLTISDQAKQVSVQTQYVQPPQPAGLRLTF